MSNKNKIDSLINIINELSLDAFLISHNDEFMNEHLPPDAERLSWLTDFTGSAGNALIFTEGRKSVLFVDGRYTLQAAKEVDTTIFDIVCTDNIPMNLWMSKNLSNGTNIGYYPWFYSVYEIEELSKSCKKTSSLLHAIDRNIIDELWDDRPIPAVSSVDVVPLNVAGLHIKTKIDKVKEYLYKNKIDATIITAPDAISWLLNIRGRNVPYSPVVLAFAIVSPNKPVELIMNLEKISPEIIEHFRGHVHLVSINDFRDVLMDLSGQRISIDATSCPMEIFRELQSNSTGHSRGFISKKTKIIFKPDICEQLKAIKHRSEIAGMESCHIKDGVAVTKFLCWFDEKISHNGEISEIDASNALYNLRKTRAGFSENSFATIAATGKNGAIVHYRATADDYAKITKEDVLFLCDSGGQYKNEGTTDITRTIPTTEEIPEEIKRNYTLVLKGHIAASSAVFKKGETGHKIDKLARSFLQKQGLDYAHGTGHGVGCYLNVHEGPQKISRKDNKVPLEAGMVISIEPGYYKENEYGIRIENLVQIVWNDEKMKKMRFKPLTLVPIDTRLVNEDMLSTPEKEWLNHYHDKVKSAIYELLEPYEQKWFDKNVKKLK